MKFLGPVKTWHDEQKRKDYQRYPMVLIMADGTRKELVRK